MAETRRIGASVGGVLRAGDVVVLAGDLGTGKTAFVQGLAEGLGVEERVVSPSFMIVREYEGRLPLTHVDVYRLDRFQELFDIGFEEVVSEERVTVIEWGDRITPLVPGDHLAVRLVPGEGTDERWIELEGRGHSWAPRRGALEAAVSAWAAEGGTC